MQLEPRLVKAICIPDKRGYAQQQTCQNSYAVKAVCRDIAWQTHNMVQGREGQGNGGRGTGAHAAGNLAVHMSNIR